MRVEKVFNVAIKEFNDEERTITAVASTEAPDRFGDVVRQDGWELDNFKKNPVLLWMHNYDQPPIGKVLDIKVENGKLVFKAQFANEGTHPLADTVYELYKQGILRAFSVGFIPKDFDRNEHGGYTYTRQELLEISAVTVPANQEALAMALKSIAHQLKPQDQKAQEEEPKEEGKAVPPKHNPPVDEDSPWDKNKAIAQLRKWASKDGSGDKDTIDWNKYRMGFGWYDADNKENFGAYKLPHHYVKDGQLVTAKRGVFAAMAALMGARGGVDIPDDDVPKVYNHLANHYAQFDMEPPPLKMVMWIREWLREDDDEEDDTLYDATKELIDARLEELERRLNVLEMRVELLKLQRANTSKNERRETHGG